MEYKRKINDEQVKRLEDKLKNEINVLIENGITISAQIGTMKDILIDRNIITEKEFNDRVYDKLYEILSATNLI
ncbi:hypothetical protein [Clostridium felsineum]|uniref:Uncharacterized protein n=1 Tax=Clostridium felsineum TaxID=36839 RepID=A0A1S8M2E2_9CLOT|nr:hypothetical protein [Clostridium felsineum]URZ06782.1 hypothetical protein CLROS_021150 [Clostridium felsineum]URZ11814.1 hypothetical protein CROST_025310 [Clostridium felsineum]